MSTTCSMTLQAVITEGTSGTIVNRVFPNDDATITEYVDDVTVIAAGATDQLLSLAAVGGTARHLWVQFSGACSFKLQNTGAPALAIGAGGGAMALVAGSITALYVTNPGTAAITVKRVAAA